MPAENITPFGLRMPAEVRAWVEAEAQQNLRSMNAEILLALKEKMGRNPPKAAGGGK
ncbi:hypothetical protein LPJGGPFB_03154 [Ensifer adhaerens]|uniref:Arc family DNA-binding protein n=1 Tax=Ensifer adhaerens TaxID=106592 RepID=UPI001567F546|nr:Arc family DNA-binding protein [Ensifer adhaerens]NRP19896.1 hypothetical protein [Ensifer adhaerens]